MALPASGAISLNAINVELQKTATAQISLNDSNVRSLLAKPSGQISLSDAYGKSNAPPTTYSGILTVGIAGNDIIYWEGWNSDPTWGQLFGSFSPLPLGIPGGGNVVGILAMDGTNTILGARGTAKSSITINFGGVNYTFTYYGSSNGVAQYSNEAYLFGFEQYEVTVLG